MRIWSAGHPETSPLRRSRDNCACSACWAPPLSHPVGTSDNIFKMKMLHLVTLRLKSVSLSPFYKYILLYHLTDTEKKTLILSSSFLQSWSLYFPDFLKPTKWDEWKCLIWQCAAFPERQGKGHMCGGGVEGEVVLWYLRLEPTSWALLGILQ